MYWEIKKALKTKKFILVDFFDTVMFRTVHPFQVIDRWAVCMIRKYPFLQKIGHKGLVSLREEAARICERGKEEPTYNDVIKTLYALISNNNIEDIDQFVHFSHTTEMALERGCQYPNKKMIDFLQKARKNGKRVYCVSDFYLSQDDIIEFAKWGGILDCFDRIFVSSEFNKSKRTGRLYPIVLKEINAKPNEVIMIGDNKHSDGRNARFHKIKSFVIPNYCQRLQNQLSRRLSYDYSKNYLNRTIRKCYKKGEAFSEYTTLFYVFTKRLYQMLLKGGVSNVTFLAREGHYLCELFEKYRHLCIPQKDYISTAYFKCSRRSIRTVQPEQLSAKSFGNISLRSWLKAVGLSLEEVSTCVDLALLDLDKISLLEESKDYQTLMQNQLFITMLQKRLDESKTSFLKYVNTFKSTNQLHIVDVGWKGTMQQGIEKITGIPTVGYYIGTIGTPEDPYIINRNGMIFSDNNGKSPYYDILRTNTQLYEQLLAAPHGSAQRYLQDQNGDIHVEEEWADNEKLLYYNTIQSLQSRMSTIFESICVWNTDSTSKIHQTKQLADMVLKSALFANKKKVDFLSELDKGFIWNFTQEKKGITYEAKHVDVNILELIVNPVIYTRYFAKIQRYISDKNNRLLSIIYYPLALIIYLHIKLTQLIRKEKEMSIGKISNAKLKRDPSIH